MNNARWDPETGGILFANTQNNAQAEIRPVFHEELDGLGLSRFWNYAPSSAPYMWGVNNAYYYRGRKLLEFGTIKRIREDRKIVYFDESSLGMTLSPVDIGRMTERNRRMMDGLVRDTLRLIDTVYMEHGRNKDIVYAGYSGGKDSVVMLDLIKRILPPSAYFVLHSNSGMDASCLTAAAERELRLCESHGLRCIRAMPEFDAKDLWRRIGPPSRANRWCCQIQQITVSRMALMEQTGKRDFTSLAYLGNRALESTRRAKYSFIQYDPLQDREALCNPIINWSSAEVFQYIFMRNLPLNEAYRKGAQRVSCVVCPLAPAIAQKRNLEIFAEESATWEKLIEDAYELPVERKVGKKSILEDGDWQFRNGSIGTVYRPNHREYIKDGDIHIEFFDVSTDWRMWMKTLGSFSGSGENYTIEFKGRRFPFRCMDVGNQTYVTLPVGDPVADADFIRAFRTVFIKAAYCIGCHSCEAECPRGCIVMRGGKVEISDQCDHCGRCHSKNSICYVYRSKYNPNEVLE